MSTLPVQYALPFSLKEAVSVQRAAEILGVSKVTVYRMMQNHVIEFIQRGEAGTYHIRYRSLVEYCDGLRTTFSLPDRRPQLSNPILRYADRDILPFPLDETVHVQDLMRMLGLEKRWVIQLANSQKLQSYQLTPVSPWRFYRPDVLRYAEAISGRGQKRPSQLYSGWSI